MRLTQIKLAGFKSFVDPTLIPTPSERVGVVGPNGCGKSNLIDAVRWVLGESRASELRGASMQDVIFNGATGRKPAARASVELFFDNGSGRVTGPWAAFSEIAVRRVLARDGASDYFINNQLVRRRDIHDLFSGTGLGARGYAIIGQGMINRLIEARPEELRVFLEEAAGVSRYKDRRRETGLRLRDARDNLARLEDLQQTLATQLRQLESQARQAERYHALQRDAARAQHETWLLQEAQATARCATLQGEIEGARTALEAAVAQLRSLEAALEASRSRHFEAAEATHQCQGRLYETGAEVSRLEAEVQHATQARRKLGERLAALRTRLDEWRGQGARARAGLDEMQGQLTQARDRAETAGQASQALLGSLPAREAQARQLAEARDTARDAASHEAQQLARAEQAQREMAARADEFTMRLQRLQAEAQQGVAVDPEALRQAQAQDEACEAALAQVRDALEALEGQGPALEAARTEARQHEQALQLERQRLATRHETLNTLQESIRSSGQLGDWLRQHALADRARLWQQVTVTPGWERALEAVLGERLASLQVDALEPVAAWAQTPPPAVLVMHQASDRARAAAPPPVVTPDAPRLLDQVRAHTPALQAVLACWLSEVYLADDLSQALARRTDLPAGAAWVVREGHRVDAASVRFHAPDDERAGVLAREREIDALARQLQALEAALDAARAAQAQAVQACDHHTQALRDQRQRVASETRALHEAQLARRELTQQAERFAQASARIARDRDETLAQQALLDRRREDQAAREADCRARLAQCKHTCDTLDQEWREVSDSLAEARARAHTGEREAQAAQHAVETLQQRQAALARSLQQSEEQMQRLQDERAALEAEDAILQDEAVAEALQDALQARARAESALAAARRVQEAAADAVRQADESRLRAEQALDPLREQLAACQLEAQASRLARDGFTRQLDEAQADRAALQAGLEARAPAQRDVAWLEAEHGRATRALAALGAVNLAASETLAQVREQHAYQLAQHADLLKAITTLEAAIRTIDRDTRNLLRQTFEAVNGHFGRLFPQLFGGGEARLILSGDEILDAGVEVMAQPPGKRNTRIQQLSGGEKALTAIALVFALFELNPAPMCLLDEVDAPLDDANTERYAQLVRDMSARTQFIFISHNKIAMQMARQLVGVTMQEQGVSRIVAVDMDAALAWAEQAA